MIEANIVIIDSGLEYSSQIAPNVKGGIHFFQNSNGKICRQKTFNDEFGHGTAIFNMVHNGCDNATFFIIKIFDTTSDCNQSLLIYSLEYIYENIKCDFILLSSGAVMLNDLEQFETIAEKLYLENKSIIISAYNNEGALSYPATSKYVIGVDSSSVVSQQASHYIIEGSPINILCYQQSYRITWLNGRKLVQKGNSYSAAFFATKIYNAYKQTGSKNIADLMHCIQKDSNVIVFERPCLKKILNPSFLSDKKRLRAIAFPFSKEVKVLAANESLLQVDIINYCDVRESGKVGLKISDILGYGSNTKYIKNIDNIVEEADYDLIICGHLDSLNRVTRIDWEKRLKEIAKKNAKYLYFFDYVTDRTQDSIYSPPLIKKYNGYTLGKIWQINSPVLGVFGTSSIQGKFSLQLKLRESFIKDGYSIKQISTEPTGPLFGMDFVCPIGYNSSIKLKGNDAAKFYNELVHECDKADTDLIIVGCQSATLPYSCYHEQYFTFQQIEFLFGSNPDAVILVINEFDDVNYVKRTIDFIESAINAKVLACVKSPVKSIVYNKDNIKENFSRCLNIPVFEFNTQFDLLYNSIIDFFGGTK